MIDRSAHRESPKHWTNQSTQGIVSSAHYLATQIGSQILGKGGNAVDAAIAVSVALGVVEPGGSGLGGMTMMMLHLARQKRTLILAGPCHAPHNATVELAAQFSRRRGYRAIAVPTNPAVLSAAHKQFATMPLPEILSPVIQLAREGFPITPFQNYLREHYLKAILKGNAAPFLLDENLRVPKPGSMIKNRVLAQTIEQLAGAGFDDFYRGEIGRIILKDMAHNASYLSETDFAENPGPQEMEPIWASFRNWKIAALPPPGGGIALLQMLNLFEGLEPVDFNPDSPEAALLFTRIIQRCRKDRRLNKNMPIDFTNWDGPDLASKTYAKATATEMQNQWHSGETTHFNIIDAGGNVVAATQSIERSFGAKVATPGLGFLYNGFMAAFRLKDKKHPHYLRPGAVARSNAAPTIIFENDRPKYAIGSTGSERMASGIFQVLIRLYKNQSPFDAVKAPRLHCTPEGEVWLEADRFAPGTIDLLKKHGFKIVPYDSAWAFSAGGLNLATLENGIAGGVGEPRRDGWAAGPE